MKEVIQGIYVDGLTEVQIFDRLEELIKKDGKVQITEDAPKKIGFNSGATESSDCKEAEEKEAAAPQVIQSPNRNKIRVAGFN